MRTAQARNWRIAGTRPVTPVRRIVRRDGVPCRREDSGNAIPDSSRFAPLGEARARYPWRVLVFAWDKPHRRRWGRNRRSFEGRRSKYTARDPAQLYREMEESGWTFFFRPQFRTKE